MISDSRCNTFSLHSTFSSVASDLPKMQIKDHVFYVTGGASGLGAATAEHLHRLGAYIAIMDLNLALGKELAEKLNASGGKRATAFEVDVCEEEAVSEAIRGADEKWPGVKVGGCINCGGVGMAGKIINANGEPFDLDTFRKVVDINLIGTFNVSRLTAARLVRDVERPIPKPTSSTVDLGVIINTASAAALEGQSGQCSYAASKGGVLSLTLPMARDLAWFGIRTMTLAPALFETPMMEKLPDRQRNAILRMSEFPVRFGKPDEFAAAVQACIENSMLVSHHRRSFNSEPKLISAPVERLLYTLGRSYPSRQALGHNHYNACSLRGLHEAGGSGSDNLCFPITYSSLVIVELDAVRAIDINSTTSIRSAFLLVLLLRKVLSASHNEVL